MSAHTGEIPIEEVARHLKTYLEQFEEIAELYRYWGEQPLKADGLNDVIESLPKRPARMIQEKVEGHLVSTVYDAYNVATYYATHRMRSFRGAFDLLKKVNRGFQEFFPISPN